MIETQKKIIKFEIRTFVVLVCAVIGGGFTFGICYNNVIRNQEAGFARIENRIDLLEQKYGYQIQSNSTSIDGLDKRVTRLETIVK